MAAATSISGRGLAWLCFLSFTIGFVLFFVAFCGHSWWVTPPDHYAYPPDDPYNQVTMGLFYLCAWGHCKYDLRIQYMVVQVLPYKVIQDAYQNYRTAVMVIEVIAALMLLIALAAHLFVLAGFKLSRIAGFLAAGIELLSAIVALIGVIIYGSKFRGISKTLPFGWSYWLMVAAIIIHILTAVFTGLITAFSLVYVHRRQQQSASAVARPLASGF